MGCGRRGSAPTSARRSRGRGPPFGTSEGGRRRSARRIGRDRTPPWPPSPWSPSEVDRPPVDGEGRLADDLRQRRMGVGGAADLPGRGLELEAERGLRDEVGRVWADEMDAERVPGLGVADDLGKALVLAT